LGLQCENDKLHKLQKLYLYLSNTKFWLEDRRLAAVFNWMMLVMDWGWLHSVSDSDSDFGQVVACSGSVVGSAFGDNVADGDLNCSTYNVI